MTDLKPGPFARATMLHELITVLSGIEGYRDLYEALQVRRDELFARAQRAAVVTTASPKPEGGRE